MLRTVEATIDKNGNVKLAESIKLGGRMRALVTILDEKLPAAARGSNEPAILAESALSKEWLSKDEDEAWAYLSSLPDLDEQPPKKKGTGRKK
jgi:hypothetical protein